tara:strand:- start:2048 stop:2734 length:687 start_codon:yes stop_codon:yes gene_type:complete
VLKYTEEELILLRVRDNKTGSYIDLEDIKGEIGSIRTAPLEELRDLDTLVKECETVKDKEGWVLHTIDENGDDFFYKLKTVWYFDLHGLFTSDLYREHILVRYILNEEIDDIITQIPPDETEALERVDKIITVVKHELNVKSKEILKLSTIFNEMGRNYKDFGMKYQKKDPNFGFVMSIANSSKGLTEFDMAKKFIGNKYDKLEKCRKWLMEKDESIFEYLIIEDVDE